MVYDSTGRTLAQVNELGCRTTFGYDQRGSRIAVTNARGFTWTASFDALGRSSASVDPLGRRTTFSFDARSQITQQTDGKGQVESRTYDALGRQIGTLYATGKLVTTTFDLLGRKTAEANENGTWNRTYDALGQRLTEVGPGYPSGLPLTSVYDSVGNRTQLQTWRGSQSWSFDGLNRSRTLVDIEGGTYTWSYEPRGYLNRLDYPNGVIFSVAYGSTGRPWQGSYSSAADSQVELVEYSAYDAVDNPTTMHQYFGGTHGNGRAMSYDAANQLTYWSDSDTEGPTTVFDPAGNPSSAKVGGFTYSYTYDAADELVNLTTVQPYDPAFTSATFVYDGNGNRKTEQFFQSFTSGPRTDLTTYTWDSANRLLQIQQSASGAVDLTNSYRPDGLRHQRTDNSGTTEVLWDGDEPLAQVDTLGNLQRYWSRAGAPAGGSWMAHWSRLVKARLPGNPYADQYLHADAQGTILAVSGSNGAALTHNQPPPRAWGMDGTLIAPFSWQGEHGYWYEGQLARPMHYVRARWFVDGGPGIGGAPGWLSPDPLRFGGGDSNLYRYVRNRPTVVVDPSGMQDCRDVGISADSPWAGWEMFPAQVAALQSQLETATGLTFCSFLSSQPVTKFNPNANQVPCCSCKCLEAHEERHRKDFAESACCGRLFLCAERAISIGASTDNPGPILDCTAAFCHWSNAFAPWTECNAYTTELACLAAQFHQEGCDLVNLSVNFACCQWITARMMDVQQFHDHYCYTLGGKSAEVFCDQYISETGEPQDVTACELEGS